MLCFGAISYCAVAHSISYLFCLFACLLYAHRFFSYLTRLHCVSASINIYFVLTSYIIKRQNINIRRSDSYNVFERWTHSAVLLLPLLHFLVLFIFFVVISLPPLHRRTMFSFSPVICFNTFRCHDKTEYDMQSTTKAPTVAANISHCWQNTWRNKINLHYGNCLCSKQLIECKSSSQSLCECDIFSFFFPFSFLFRCCVKHHSKQWQNSNNTVLDRLHTQKQRESVWLYVMHKFKCKSHGLLFMFQVCADCVTGVLVCEILS